MKRHSARIAMTLVELLVVCGLIATLAGITIAFMPSVHGKDDVINAGTQLRGWLNIAKQRALRDGAPRGVRLYIDAADIRFAGKAQYIGVPDDYSVGTVYCDTTAVDCSVTDAYSGGFPDNAAGRPFWPVQPGDFVEFGSAYSPAGPHRIATVSTGAKLALALGAGPNIPSGSPTNLYVIIRAPRVLSGEADLKFPPNVAVDVETNSLYGNPLPASPAGMVDIVFTPSGAVLNAVSDKIQIWLRDPSRKPQAAAGTGGRYAGELILVTVYTRTGLISMNAVDMTPNPAFNPGGPWPPYYYLDPYSFTRDGRASGF